MRKIIIFPSYAPLGTGIQMLTKEKKKWIYIVPSASLIQELKENMFTIDSDLQRYVEFMTFDQMVRRFHLNDKKRLLSPQEQELLVKRAIEHVDQKVGLNYFHQALKKVGLINKIEIWIGEFKRTGLTPERLDELWKNRSEKYQELILIFKAYQELLEHFAFIDHEEPYLTIIKNGITSNSLIEYQGIITEQLYDFSPIQIEVLNKLANLELDIYIHLSFDEQRKDLYKWTSNTIDYLTELGFEKEKRIPNIIMESPEPLKQIQQQLFSAFPTKIDAGDSIEIMELAGQKQEIEMIAAEIKHLVVDHGYKPEDIALIFPKIEKYQDMIYKVMGKTGINYRLNKRESLIKNPFIQSVISFLRASNAQKSDFLTIITSPYFNYQKSVEPSFLLTIFKFLSYPMSKETWEERLAKYIHNNEENREALLKADSMMQQIFLMLAKTPTKGTYQEFISHISSLEEEFSIKEKIQAQLIQHPTSELAYRDYQAFIKWQELKKELSSLDKYFLENTPLTLWNFINSLILALDKTSYDYTQGRKTGIYILEPRQIRGRTFKAVFIGGLVDGEFPKAIKNDWLIPDKDRFELRKKGIYLSTTFDYENLQKYHFFESVSAATEKLYFVYTSKNEDGKEMMRSYFIDEVYALFTMESLKKRTLEISDIVPRSWQDVIYDEQLISKIFNSLSNRTDEQEADHTYIQAGLSIYNKKHPTFLQMIKNGYQSELDKFNAYSSYDGNLNDTENLEKIKNKVNHKTWSTTELNLAANCRFAFFAQRMLNLAAYEDQEESLSPIEKGDILHHSLQKFFDYFRIDMGEDFDTDKESIYLNRLISIAEQEWERFNNQSLRFTDPVLKELDWQNIKQMLKQILKHEIYWRKNSNNQFYPAFLELSFGLPLKRNQEEAFVDPKSTENEAVIKINSDSNVRLRGKIDRVDMDKDGKFIIYDYKSGNAPKFKQIVEGINLQLPLYLFALESLFNYSSEDVVGVAFYTRGTNKNGEYTDNRNVGIWKKEENEIAGISNRVGSLMDEEKWKHYLLSIKEKLGKLMEALANGDYSVLPEDECPSYCPFQKICRRDEQRFEYKKQLRGEG